MLDTDLELNAQYMIDKHVVKMPTESAQILCTVLNQNGQQSPYKSTHVHHPCVVWCGKSLDNWKHLRRLALEICNEYTFRYGKTHQAEVVIRGLEEPNILPLGVTELPSCMDTQYVVGDNVVDNYRNYYRLGKVHLHAWKNRNTPSWIYGG
jgi:hypothetical protein